MSSRRPRLSRLLSSALILAAPAAPAAAQAPEGGQIRSGIASIEASAETTVIRQSSGRAVIDWRGFDVGRDHSVRFEQPDAHAATLNRIGGGAPSRIDGRVTAPGMVIIQNESGVIFGKGSRIDVGGLVATSGRADVERFARGGALRIEGAGLPDARVVNEGTVTIGEAGLGALVGRDVENAGTIVARRGTVALASGTQATLDLSGDGMLQIAEGAPGGRIAQSGTIEVGDGRVLLTAGAAAGALDAAINVGGVVRAGSASAKGGTIALTGAGAVRVDGSLDASATRRGGTVSISGERIELGSSARIDASGGAAGGTVRIGGDLGGSGPMPRARGLSAAPGAEIAAAGGAGAGGSVVLWSEGDTRFDGRIAATGAAGGGFVETSGHERLAIGGHAVVELGQGGQWLLDPRNVLIAATTGDAAAGINAPPPGTGPFVISRSAIGAVLNAGSDVTVTTVQPDTSQEGTITVADALTWSGPGSLTLRAEADVRIDAPVRSTGAGSFTIDANRELLLGASVEATGTGDISLIARVGDIGFANPKPTDEIVATRTGSLDLEARKGSILIKRSGGAVPGNIQLFSDAGPTRLKAGREILLQGGNHSGRWVRLGHEASASSVSLEAPRIAVQGGTSGNTFAEIVTGAGGAIDLRAMDITVQNGGDQALVQAFGGASLSLRAERQTWNGPVRAGTGAANGGEVVLSGAIDAGVQPIFNLAPGRSFRLDGLTPRGRASGYRSSESLVVRTRGTGTVAIAAPVSAERVTLESREAVEVAATGRLAGTAGGDAIVVAAGRRFVNRGDAEVFALGDAGARWLLYIDGFDGLDGPVPAEHGFDLYGRSYADQPPATIDHPSHRIIYAEQPVLRIEAGSARKTYGEAATPAYTVSGLRPGDTLDTALVAAPYVKSPGMAPTAGAGSYATSVAAESSSQGYLLETVPGTLTVERALLTIRAADARRTYGAADPAIAATYEGFVLGEGPDALQGRLAFASEAEAASRPGDYALTPRGVTSDNYAVSFAPGTLTIERAPLRVVAEDATGEAGTGLPRFAVRYDGFVLGEDERDLRGSLDFGTDATEASPPGRYAITPGGVSSDVYVISFLPGRFTLLPASGPTPTDPPPAPPAPPVPAPTPGFLAAASPDGFDPIRRGLAPLTPGDASFRTTIAEAPPALSAPFVLTYSLGEVSAYAAAGPAATGPVGFVPASGGAPVVDTTGFVPAAGGTPPPEDEANGGCRGAVRLPQTETCILLPREESFWTTREEGLQ